MRGKAVMAAITLAAGGALAVSGTAGAGGEATTKVTIKAPGGEVYGTVKSSNPDKCANGRKVRVYRQKGGSQGGGDDIKIGSDIAQPNGGQYQWNLGNPGVSGKKIFAKATSIPGCKKDSSRTIVAG